MNLHIKGVYIFEASGGDYQAIINGWVYYVDRYNDWNEPSALSRLGWKDEMGLVNQWKEYSYKLIEDLSTLSVDMQTEIKIRAQKGYDPYYARDEETNTEYREDDEELLAI